jgi:hypothetical protein
MAVCRIIETGTTPEQYEQVRSRLGVEGNRPPGALVHIAAKGEDGKIRIIDVWDSREQAEQWGEKVRAVRQELGIGEAAPPPITYFDAHRVLSIQEVSSGSKPIEGVGTAVAAFVGLVEPGR